MESEVQIEIEYVQDIEAQSPMTANQLLNESIYYKRNQSSKELELEIELKNEVANIYYGRDKNAWSLQFENKHMS